MSDDQPKPITDAEIAELTRQEGRTMDVKEAMAIAVKTSPTGWERYREANHVLATEIEQLQATSKKRLRLLNVSRSARNSLCCERDKLTTRVEQLQGLLDAAKRL